MLLMILLKVFVPMYFLTVSCVHGFFLGAQRVPLEVSVHQHRLCVLPPCPWFASAWFDLVPQSHWYSTPGMEGLCS